MIAGVKRLAQLLAAVMASQLLAQDVVVVRSSSAKPYERTSKLVAQKLGAQGRSVQSVVLAKAAGSAMDQWLAAERKPLFVAVGSKAAAMLQKRLPSSVALAYCMVARPEQVGLNGSRVAHGVGMQVRVADQLSLIRRALPACRRIGMLFHAEDAKSRQAVEAVRKELPEGWGMHAVAVTKRLPVAAAIDKLLARRVDIVWTAPSSAVYGAASVKVLLVKSLRAKVPVFGYSHSFVRAGALLGVGIDLQSHGRQAAELVETLLARRPDAPPFKTRVFWAPQAAVSVNLIVANRIDVALPPAVVADAQFVIREEK